MTQSPPPPPDGADPAIIEALKDLARQEAQGTRVPISVGPYTAFVLIGAIQMAYRHPGMNADPRLAAMLKTVGGLLESMFAAGPLQQLLADGWDTSRDAAPQEN